MKDKTLIPILTNVINCVIEYWTSLKRIEQPVENCYRRKRRWD